MPLAIFCGCTAWLVWDLVGNPEDRFSHNEPHILPPGGVAWLVERPLGMQGDPK